MGYSKCYKDGKEIDEQDKRSIKRFRCWLLNQSSMFMIFKICDGKLT